jgi:hypothetical protein
VEEAVDAAKNAPEPDPEQAFTDVWADGGAAWRTPAFQVSARIASQQPPAEILRAARIESTEEPPTISYREAVAEGIAREMRRDPTVVCLGEDIGAAEGVFKTTVGLFAEFGAQRVWDTPISEQAIAGAAMGAAMTGMRPVAEIMFSDFLACCWDYLANGIPEVRYMTGGQVAVRWSSAPPMVVGSASAQHSQAVELGLTVPDEDRGTVTPADVIGLMAAAIRRRPDCLLRAQGAVREQGRGRAAGSPRRARSSNHPAPRQ